jgi:hypothetical protein
MPAPRGVFALLVSFIVGSATVAAAMPPNRPAAIASWPASAGLLLAEVMTGGVSASDEYVEISNAGAADADLGGCELVYVTATGTTTTRKAGFAAPLILMHGQHLLVANAAGIYGPLADATYSGGLAADGGAVALRRADGYVIDAVGWGTATNAYVEGAVAPAPPAKSSLERRPGGSGGNDQDTNDNFADWIVQSSPIPQSLQSRPVPGSSAGPSANQQTPSSEPTLAPTATSDQPQATEPDPTTSATATPDPTATLSETPAPTASLAPSEPGATLPPAGPSTSPSASARKTEAPVDVEPIALARAQPSGTRVRVSGRVTVGPGLVGADDLIAIGDESSGIFVRWPATVEAPAIGRSADVLGTLAAPYGQLEIRDVTCISIGVEDSDPVAAPANLADVGERTEGLLVAVAGTVESVQTDSGRLTITIGDGTLSVRLYADSPAGLTRSDVARGDDVLATGIVGQRSTATGRLDGYRVWLRRPADLEVLPSIATDAPTAASTPSPAPVRHDLASAIGTRGAAVEVEATTTATAGLVDIGGPTIVVDDGTAAVAVVLPEGAEVPPAGMRVRVTGKVGSWETGPTVLASRVVALGDLQAVGPRSVTGPLSAAIEWRLVQVCGRVDRVTRAGSRWRADLTVDGHSVVVLGEPASAITLTTNAVGRLAAVTGIVRRSTSDSKTFQLLPRTALDFHLGPAPQILGASAIQRQAGSPGAAAGSGTPQGASPAGTVAIESIESLLGHVVTVAGLVTATASGAATIDDGTGAVRVGGLSAADALDMLEPGDAIEVSGLVRRDEEGLFIEADPDSIVDMPGDRGDARVTGDGLAALAAGMSTPTIGASAAAAASIRRTAAPAPLPEDLTICIVVLATLVALAAAVALTRKGLRPRRIRIRMATFPAVGVLHLAHRRPRRGKDKGS